MAHELKYSPLDRLLHRLAFAAPFIQLTAADIEKIVCGPSYDGARGGRPIFVTSLPRAGTTLVLEALSRFPSLASHVYRDMPFVLAPMLWSRLSGPFRRPATLRERAHGDGMEVGFDSPEAFEEILWRTFWPGKYTASGIALWDSGDGNPEARAFFLDHMKKIIALRRPGRLGDGRYVSKNNANIARLDFIGRVFPGAKILVPVRRPIDHARSMLRQHRNFLDMHRTTPFVRRYMADLGHYEFGEVHRPIAFSGLEALTGGRDPLNIDYWVGYWIAAFEHVMQHRESVIVMSYEHACAEPERALAAVCQRLEVEPEGAVQEAAALFRGVPRAGQGGIAVDPHLRRRAEQLHDSLVGERVH